MTLRSDRDFVGCSSKIGRIRVHRTWLVSCIHGRVKTFVVLLGSGKSHDGASLRIKIQSSILLTNDANKVYSAQLYICLSQLEISDGE